MKVSKANGVKFLQALNFERAPEWPDEKLVERLSQVPEKVAEADVPKGFEDLYKNLCKAEGDITLEGGSDKAKANGKAEAKDVKSKPAAKSAAKPAKAEKAKAKTEKPEKAAKAKSKGKEGKGRLKGLSQEVDKLIKFSAEEIFDKLKGKYPITPSWLARVVERKKKALKKVKAIKV